jgi:hypothetical protein
MRALSLFTGFAVLGLLGGSFVLAQSSGSPTCQKGGNILVSGDSFTPPSTSGSSLTPTQPVQKFRLEIGEVDLNNQIITLRNSAEGKNYPIKVDKSLKLSADKKVMQRKPELADFNKGDTVKATVNLMESRVLEIKLLKSVQGQN